MELILLIWLPLCVAVGILASRYNRSGFGWFVFSLLLSPLLGFAFVLACGPYSADPAQEQTPREAAPAEPTAARAMQAASADRTATRVLGAFVALLFLGIVGSMLSREPQPPEAEPFKATVHKTVVRSPVPEVKPTPKKAKQRGE